MTYIDTILQGDAWELAKTLPDASVQCIITSPPYFGLRDYGTAQWEGGDPECDHTVSSGGPSQLEGASQRGRSDVAKGDCPRCNARRVDSQFGLEATPEAYVARLVELFRELRRALRADGTAWLNLGDSYASQGGPEPSQTKWAVDGASKTQNGGYSRRPGTLKPKDLCGIPWAVAFALRADGWYLRSDIIWHKPNPMPESVTDRPTRSHEYIFLLSKSAQYFYDADAVREPHTFGSGGWQNRYKNGEAVYSGESSSRLNPHLQAGGAMVNDGYTYNEAGRNRRSVWTAEAIDPLCRLRSDLTPEQRAYVLQRIADEG